MKKWLALIAGFAVLAATSGALWLWFDVLTTSPPQLAIENFPRIQNGMTQKEVEALLGGPPGNYGRHQNGGGEMTMEGYIAPANSKELIWCDDNNRFEIYFDQQNRVVGFHRRAGYTQTPPESILTWLRRQVGL